MLISFWHIWAYSDTEVENILNMELFVELNVYSNFILRTSRCETPVIFYSQNSNKSVTSRLHQQKNGSCGNWEKSELWAVWNLILSALRSLPILKHRVAELFPIAVTDKEGMFFFFWLSGRIQDVSQYVTRDGTLRKSSNNYSRTGREKCI